MDKQPNRMEDTSARSQLPSVSSPTAIFGLIISLGVAFLLSQDLFVLFNTLVTVGLAFAITGFCTMVHPLSRWSTLDILGAGALAGGISLMASVFILLNPQASKVSVDELLSELWLLLIFVESLSLFVSTKLLGKRIARPIIVWVFITVVAASVLMALFADIPWVRLFYHGSYSGLGFAMLFAIFGLLTSSVLVSIRKITLHTKIKEWSIGVAVIATLLIITSMTLLPNLISNSWAATVGHLAHMLAYVTLFIMILTTVILNPMSSIFKKLYDERELYAEWDRLSAQLLELTERVAQADSYLSLAEVSSYILKESFNITGMEICLMEGIQGTPSEMAPPYILDDMVNFNAALDHALRQMRQRTEDSDDLIRFSLATSGTEQRFACRKLLSKNRTIGFILVARNSTEVYPSNELLVRYFDKFAATITLAINRLQIEAQHELLLEEERYVADTLQRAMRPTIPELPQITQASRLIPASGLTKIGGDFLDAFAGSTNQTVYFMIGDISGHGVEATSHNSFVRAAMKAIALTGLKPAEIMTQINNLICSDLPEDTYVTAICGTINTTNGRCEICIAGHPEPVVVRNNNTVEIATQRSPLLGFKPNVTYVSYEFALQENDGLVLYTDGITDARSKSRETFGQDRLVDMITSHRGQTPETTLDRLYAALSKFQGGLPPHDDQAALVLRWIPKQ